MKIFNEIIIFFICYFGLDFGKVSSSRQHKSSQTRPHIIFILADDLGWNDVGFHGSDVISTPNIDALAYSGVILNNYYVQPLCTPSRSALLTGMYPIHTGLQHSVILQSTPYGLPLNFTLFPQYLKGLGYSTKIVGKWHLGNFRKEYTPTFRGFDSHYGYWGGSIDYFTRFSEISDLPGYDFRRNLDIEYPKNEDAYVTDLLTEESVRIINEHNSSKPLFLFLSHLATHVVKFSNPLQAPEEDIQRFSYIKNKERRTYAAMLWKLDESVGRVVKALQDNNMLDDSIIVFSTDNGGESGGYEDTASSNWPLRGSKYLLLEGGVRGSAFVWSSQLRNPGRVSMEMMHITDWFPTLYHAIGGSESVLPKMDGMNVWRSIQGNSPSPRNEILVNINPIVDDASIRVGEWKLIYNSLLDPTLFGPEYHGWFGPKDRDLPRKDYLNTNSKYSYIQEIKTSLAGRIVLKLMPNIFENIKEIRKNSEVLCPEIPADATASCFDPSNPCLFNVASDPCEYYDVSKSHPELVELLQNRLRFYNSTAIPPGYKPQDPRANPIYWNNTWINWFDYIDGNSYNYAY